MKRKIAFFLALVLVFSALPITVGAQDEDEWVVLYRLTEDPAFTDVEIGSEFDFENHPFLVGHPSSTITVEEYEDENRRLQIVTHDADEWTTSGFTIPLTELSLDTNIVVQFRIDTVQDEGAMFILQRDHTPLNETHTALRGAWDFEEGDEFIFAIMLNDFNLTPAEGYEDIPLGFSFRMLGDIIVNVSITEIVIQVPPETETETETKPEQEQEPETEPEQEPETEPEVEPETEPELEPEYNVINFVIGNVVWTNNGVEQAPLEAAPFLADNRAMIPLRFVAEALGAEVALLRGAPRVVVIELGDIELRLTIGEALPNGMGTPVIVGGRVFVPIGYVSDVLGATTRWCDDTNSVYVYVPVE